MVITLRLAVPLFLLYVPLAAPLDALAVPITYTITGNANITFGGGRNGDTPFTIRALGDTANIVGNSIRTLENIVAKVLVDGFPEATFTNNFHLRVNNANSMLTFGGVGDASIELSHPTFSSYNLATNHGPVFFSGVLRNGLIRQQPTTSGQIILAEIRNVTFTAAVPEPSGLVPFAIAMAWLFGRRRH